MSGQFGYRFVTATPSDMADLAAAGLEGWEAVALAPVGGTFIVLIKRKLLAGTQRSSPDATPKHLEGWLPVTHPETST